MCADKSNQLLCIWTCKQSWPHATPAPTHMPRGLHTSSSTKKATTYAHTTGQIAQHSYRRAQTGAKRDQRADIQHTAHLLQQQNAANCRLLLVWHTQRRRVFTTAAYSACRPCPAVASATGLRACLAFSRARCWMFLNSTPACAEPFFICSLSVAACWPMRSVI